MYTHLKKSGFLCGSRLHCFWEVFPALKGVSLAGQGAPCGTGSGELCPWLLLSVPGPADVKSEGACLRAGPKPGRWLWRPELGLDSWHVPAARSHVPCWLLGLGAICVDLGPLPLSAGPWRFSTPGS